MNAVLFFIKQGVRVFRESARGEYRCHSAAVQQIKDELNMRESDHTLLKEDMRLVASDMRHATDKVIKHGK